MAAISPKLERKIIKLTEQYPEKRTALLPAFYLAQDDYGFIPKDVMAEIADIVGVSKTEAYNVATYYTYFYVNKPTGKYIIRMCDSISCYLNKNEVVRKALEKELKIKVGNTTKDNLFSLEVVECLGACAKAPAVMINEKLYEKVTSGEIKEIISSIRSKEGVKK